jgi:predicted TPR repeat methyltransferase
MLAEAAEKQLYAELREADLVQMLAEDTASWPLILAADVLCYFGDLHEVFGCVYQRLDAQGWFLCSVEELLPDKDGVVPGNGEWALHRQGRYAHSLEYLATVARETGFAVQTLERQTVRYEANAPVAGIFAVLGRAH